MTQTKTQSCQEFEEFLKVILFLLLKKTKNKQALNEISFHFQYKCPEVPQSPVSKSMRPLFTNLSHPDYWKMYLGVERLNLDIFTHVTLSKTLPQVLINTHAGRRKILILSRQHLLENIFSPQLKKAREEGGNYECHENRKQHAFLNSDWLTYSSSDFKFYFMLIHIHSVP